MPSLKKPLTICFCFLLLPLFSQDKPSYNISYQFGLQRLDFFHQVGVGKQWPHLGLELQQGLGQRNLFAGMVFSQTGIQGSWRLSWNKTEMSPYLRYSYGRLGKPIGFNYHRTELGIKGVYKLSSFTKFPLDITLSGGAGQGWEIQSHNKGHNFLDYSINLGLRYALYW